MTDKIRDSFLDFNLTFFSDQFQKLIIAHRNSLSFSDDPVTVFPSRRGSPTLKWNGKNLHSIIDPLIEATRKMEGLDINRYTTVVYLGADLLYRLDAADFSRSASNLILVFVNWNFLIKVLEARPLKVLKHFTKVEAFILEDDQLFFDRLQNSLTPATMILYNEVLLQSWGELQRVSTQISEHIRLLMSSFFTRYYFEKRWMKNVLQNWVHPEVKSFFELKGKFQGKKAILTGAGVSLDAHLDDIRQLNRRKGGGYFICTVDTALPVLLENGISPDAIVALDGGFSNAGDFYPSPDQDTILITYPHLYPSVLRNFSGPIYFFSFYEEREGLSSSLILAWEKWLGRSGGKIKPTGNVSVAALEVLAEMGFAEVVFSGIDFNSPFFLNHPPAGIHHRYYHFHHHRFKNIETSEFNETFQRMGQEDKVLLQSDEQWGVPTLLLKQSAQEFLLRIKAFHNIRWRCFSSPFTRLPEWVERVDKNDLEKVTWDLPVMDDQLSINRKDFFQYLEDLVNSVDFAEKFLDDYQRHLDEEVLQKDLKSLGYNFLEIYCMVFGLQAGLPPDLISQEIKKILSMMRSVLTSVIKRSC